MGAMVDISRSRIRNLIAALHPQFEFHEILSTKPIRSYSTARTSRPRVCVLKETHTHTHRGAYIDPAKVSDTLTQGELRDPREREREENGRTKNHRGRPNFRGNVAIVTPEYFPRVLPLFFLAAAPTSILFSFFSEKTDSSSELADAGSSAIERTTLDVAV